MPEPARSRRNPQLDGWRAAGVMSVMWVHWTPREWRGSVPFEIGLFFFLTLSGFLITRILLRQRAEGEAAGGPWKGSAYRNFLSRRAIRIMIPCYLAMIFAIVARCPDIMAYPGWYFAHLANFHIALLPDYPFGTAHYWTLAIQQQFYLLWPLFLYFVPRRWLGPFLITCVLIAPVSRAVIAHAFPAVHHPGAITPTALDYLGAGSLLALAFSRGITATDARLKRIGWIGFAGYAPLYCLSEMDRHVPVLSHLQQTFLALAMVGLIAATLAGLPGLAGRLLESRPMQHFGKLSYGLYLFHATVPMALGWIVPFLWHGGDSVPMLILRLVVFFFASWGIAWLCWRYVEQPLTRYRDRLR